MRDFKFRAWHDDTKTMVYFGLGQDNIRFLDRNGDPYHLELRFDTPVMQSTGILDRDGNEVYEGDIIKYYYWNPDMTHPKIAKIAYSTEHGSFMIFGIESWAIWFVHGPVVEVIGDIYETPELMPGPIDFED